MVSLTVIIGEFFPRVLCFGSVVLHVRFGLNLILIEIFLDVVLEYVFDEGLHVTVLPVEYLLIDQVALDHCLARYVVRSLEDLGGGGR